jgi:integrase
VPRPRAEGPKRVAKTLRDGSVWYYYYDRVTGKQVSKERADAVVEGVAQPGTLAALIADYRATARFKSRKPGTREIYGRTLNYLRATIGDLQVSAITPGNVQAIKDSLQEMPSKANQTLAILSILFKLAIRRGQIMSNPAASPGRLEVHKRSEIWSEDEEQRILAAFRPSLKLALMLLLYTLQRPSDVLAMTLGQVIERDGRLYIVLRQQKTDELLAVPVHGNLVPFLRQRMSQRLTERQRGPDGQMMERISTLLVPSPRGMQWPRRNFSRAWDHDLASADKALRKQLAGEGWSAERIEQELVTRHRQRRDLRRTGMVRLAELGVSTRLIAAVSGHSIDYCQRILETYIPRRTEMALAAIEAWEQGGKAGQRVVRLADATESRAQAAVEWAPVSETELETEFPKPNERRKKRK